jgi:hypothetical protein
MLMKLRVRRGGWDEDDSGAEISAVSLTSAVPNGSKPA